MQSKLVSVIMPCYNQGRFLRESVESVLAQTHPLLEIIIVNDGSTDETDTVARQLEIHPQVRYFPLENQGVSAARNYALSQAEGDYIQFLDADDYLLPDKIKLQLEQLRNVAEPALAYCDYYHCSATDVHERKNRDDFEPPTFQMAEPLFDIIWRWETEFSIPIHSFLFQRSLFVSHNVQFDTTLNNHVDWDCWVSIFSLRPKILYSSQQMVAYRLHEISICTDTVAMGVGFEKAIKKQLKLNRAESDVYHLLKQKLVQTKTRYAKRWQDKLTDIIRYRYQKLMPWFAQKWLHQITSSRSHSKNNH